MLTKLSRIVNRKLLDGGADPDRTGDPLLAKQVLSQLSYSPFIFMREQTRMLNLGCLLLLILPWWA